jgi:hypothetical protein
MGMARQQQQEAAVASALALCCQFTVHWDALEKVKVFKYLGRMMAQDNNNAQAMQYQLRKARGTWACIGQVLRSENATPRVAAKFLQGSSTGCTPLWQQDVEPHKSCTGTAKGVSCSSRLLHGTGSSAKAGGWEPMGISKDV